MTTSRMTTSRIIGSRTLAIASLALGVSLLIAAIPAKAQSRGTHGASGARMHSFGGGSRARYGRPLHSSAGYIFYPDFYDYGYDSGYEYEGGPQGAPVQIAYAQPNVPAPPAQKEKPAASLILEEHDGQWVRVLTGSQLPVQGQPAAKQYAPVPSHPGYMESRDTPSQAKLPPATLVFRDGHQEQVDKYVIHGNALYMDSDYFKTGSWTREIPLNQIDIPASVKANADRGTKFNLPSGPNEVVVRF